MHLCLLGRLDGLTALALPLQDPLAVLVELELGDDDVGGREADGDSLAVGLVAGEALDVDDVFETVDRGDLALTALVGSPNNGDLVVLADGNGADLLASISNCLVCRGTSGSALMRVFQDPAQIKNSKWIGRIRCTSRGAPCSGERS